MGGRTSRLSEASPIIGWSTRVYALCVCVCNGYMMVYAREKNKTEKMYRSGSVVSESNWFLGCSAPAGKYLVPGASHKRATKGGMGLRPEIYGVQFRFRGPKG